MRKNAYNILNDGYQKPPML